MALRDHLPPDDTTVPAADPQKQFDEALAGLPANAAEDLDTSLDALMPAYNQIASPAAKERAISAMAVRLGLTRGTVRDQIKFLERRRKQRDDDDDDEGDDARADDDRDPVYVWDNTAAVADQVIAALVKRGVPLYQRAGHLVQVGRDGEGRPTIVTLDVDQLRDVVSRHVRHPRRVNKRWVHDKTPKEVLAVIHARGDYRDLPELRGIACRPFVRRDGSVCTTPGYDVASQQLLILEGEVPPLVEPTRDNARAAALALLNVFRNFPFSSDFDRAALLALLVTLAARDMIDGPTPIMLVQGNNAGIGKGKLAETAMTIAMGVASAKWAECEPEDLRKIATDVARSGDQVLYLDNWTRLGGPVIEMLSTATRIKARLLGFSENIDCPWRAVMIVTANNPAIRDDTQRRLVRIRVKSTITKPHKRRAAEFAARLPQAVIGRADLHAHVLTLIRAALTPEAQEIEGEPLGSYEEWCDIAQRAVIWAYGVDPLTEVEGDNATAETKLARARVLIELRNLGKQTAGEIAELANHRDKETGRPENPGLREALSSLVNRRGAEYDGRTVGYGLRNMKDQPYELEGEQLWLRGETVRDRVLWWVETVRPSEEAPVEASEAHKADEKPETVEGVVA